ncbi:MAG: thioredoxin family protein [Armatimonadetes bacterium]|nr:thioredoxin family protein [Candidatus Dependentiae bacterium]MBA3727527.1 thioredoxin family protein [Armatimonadota bacterium]
MFSTDEFKAQGKYFVFVHIDVDTNQALKQQFGVGGIPDLRFLKSDGTEVHKVVGYKGMAVLGDFDIAREKGK